MQKENMKKLMEKTMLQIQSDVTQRRGVFNALNGSFGKLYQISEQLQNSGPL